MYEFMICKERVRIVKKAALSDAAHKIISLQAEDIELIYAIQVFTVLFFSSDYIFLTFDINALRVLLWITCKRAIRHQGRSPPR
jgi:hypothetical protein